MDHKRVLGAVVAVTAAVFIWVALIATRPPGGDMPYEVAVLVFGYGFLLGIALLSGQRGSRADRRLYARGHEGWAVITSVRHLADTNTTSDLSELQLKLTVPGSECYSGRLVRALDPYERHVLVPGATVPIRVDPRNRDRIMLCP